MTAHLQRTSILHAVRGLRDPSSRPPVDRVGDPLRLRFDADFADELDLLSTTEFFPVGFDFQFDSGVAETRESTLSREGHVFTCEAGATGDGPVNATFAICEIEFLTTPPPIILQLQMLGDSSAGPSTLR